MEELEKREADLEKKYECAKKESRDLEQKYRNITEYLGLDKDERESELTGEKRDTKKHQTR